MEFSTTKNSLRYASWHVALSLSLGSLNSDYIQFGLVLIRKLYK